MSWPSFPADAARHATVAFAIFCAVPAHGSCPPANMYTYSFATAAPATLDYTRSYVLTATNDLGQSQNIMMTFAANGLTNSTLDTGAAIVQMPAITALINDGGTTNNNLVIGGTIGGRTTLITSAANAILTNFAFAVPVRDVSIQINDIDYMVDQYRDWLHVSGVRSASTYTPAISTPSGTNNGSGAKTKSTSSLALGVASLPFVQTAPEAVGIGSSANNANTGTLTAQFAQPVDLVRIRYGNFPMQPGETDTGQQGYGIQSISFCPMPALTVTKTAAPWSDPQNGTANPKLIPGADLIYTLVVTNADTSPVDLSTLVLTDVLPPDLIFFNGDIDDGGALTANFAFNAGVSGLSLDMTSLTYSNSGGSTYAYAPTPGYDVAVNALRFAPAGSMAANSSFSVQFRARIK